ncbi:MAG: M1 family aminopeptidase [Clostridiales bacterium]|nr:hypothetical protein [Eubacteriales bacterium]MDH7566781.1 M1 family aminopeptidase [Clostridiales bacterium]
MGFIIAGELAAVLCILIYIVCFLPDTGYVSGAGQNSPGKGTEAVQLSDPGINADIQVSGNVVSVKEEITFANAQKEIFAYIPSANLSKTTIKQISVNGDFEKEIVDGTNLVVKCERPQDKIGVQYEMVLDSRQTTLSYSGSCILLTNFLITPAVYRNNAPIMTYKWYFGDPYIYGMHNYSITFKIDKSYSIFAPGQKQDIVRGGTRIAAFEADNLRDFPAVLFESAEVRTQKTGGTTLYYVNSSASMEHVNYAFSYAQKIIGPYPYKELFIVKAPILNEGMEFSNMIFLSDKSFSNSETLKRVSYHEVLHQWFYGIIGTDQINEPFLDEGIVNYLAMRLCNDSFSENYNGNLFNLHLKDYSTREEYYELAYNSSTLYFYSLNKKLGDRFFKNLGKIYESKKYKILYYDDFIKLMN